MATKQKSIQFLVCDDNNHTRRLVSDVLAGAGYDKVHHATDGVDLLKATADLHPRVVITSSRIPGLSGLDYTRMIRAGYGHVDRTMSIIVMTDTPTQTFLTAAREAGVDEMLVRPFTGAAVLDRVGAVLLRPRRFVESIGYVGPCRRRRMLDEYGGPLRRFTDPIEEMQKAPWEAETNRELMRKCLAHVARVASEMAPGDRRQLREIYNAVREAEQLADDVCDKMMGDAARSLGRYISAIGGAGAVDEEVLKTHLAVMHKLCTLDSTQNKAREELIAGLIAVVDKYLGRRGGGRGA